MSASFTDHRAFTPGRPRSLQVQDLRDIWAVLPLAAAAAVPHVWRATLQADAVPAALAALQALPVDMRGDIVARAEMIGQQPRRAA
ncbi:MULTISPECIES: hypothetical protein [Methylorubrum]|uniref:hypothetical protein n=1 Tax=Methylorubrum TaxID=2282523 RepID=UPI0020A1FDA8|nr:MULTISPECIES: hypothetical protein [Methylorubrum]MCP1550679.1 hypothetical protein [Methylorubrum zatmanii]MCP1552708.1 hypothetical protein [Methylorubrum extorquens]MCP1580982.1 hypothetical protein [Methylorubrum extorquens]